MTTKTEAIAASIASKGGYAPGTTGYIDLQEAIFSALSPPVDRVDILDEIIQEAETAKRLADQISVGFSRDRSRDLYRQIGAVVHKLKKLRSDLRAMIAASPAPPVPVASPEPAVTLILTEALKFYSDPSNYLDTPSWDGDAECYTPSAIPVTRQEGSAICDCGNIARAAIAAAGEIAPPPVPVEQPTEGEWVTLTYTNWRGETNERAIKPLRIWFGSTEWHPEPQWLLTAIDKDKDAERDFALKDFGQNDRTAGILAPSEIWKILKAADEIGQLSRDFLPGIARDIAALTPHVPVAHAAAAVIEWVGSEDKQHAASMAACRARRKQYGQSSCEEKDGSCAECEHDMAVALRARSLIAKEPTDGK